MQNILKSFGWCSFLLVLVVAGCGGGDDGDDDNGDGGTIPQNATYLVTINGQVTFSGVPGGPPFSLSANLVVVPTVDPNPPVNNGVNPVDVGIFTGASPVVGVAGALWFGTNTTLSSLVGSTIGASAIDIAFVQVNNTTGEVSITVDGNVFGLPNARLATFNIYNATSGVTVQIHNILAGTISLLFESGGQNVSGTITLGGSSGFGGPAVSSEYRATLSGTRVQ